MAKKIQLIFEVCDFVVEDPFVGDDLFFENYCLPFDVIEREEGELSTSSVAHNEADDLTETLLLIEKYVSEKLERRPLTPSEPRLASEDNGR